MNAILSPPVLTTEQLLEFPDDGVLRELYEGQLRESSLSRRGRRHSRLQSKITKALELWTDKQPEPRGEILSGDAGFRLRTNPDTTVGIDVAYVSPELADRTPDDAYVIDGSPVLAVEILSPSDLQGNITDKIAAYLRAGVLFVWIVEPVFRTITVYQPNKQPQMINLDQELTAEPHLPGFRVAVADLFPKR